MEKSRNELISWMNDLLQLNLTKVEQAGTGAALCQIMDSIYGDVPLHKVKFNTNQEYEYIQNFKVLQAVFLKHGIDKFIPVDKLIKMKFQDNLVEFMSNFKEFLQWINKYWESHYQGNYDPIARRKGLPSQAAKPIKTATASKPIAAVQKARESTPVKKTELSGSKLNQTITELNLTIDTLEKERDFYFCKLREIESLVQSDGVDKSLDLVKRIQEILYNTEEGFETPDGNLADETF